MAAWQRWILVVLMVALPLQAAWAAWPPVLPVATSGAEQAAPPCHDQADAQLTEPAAEPRHAAHGCCADDGGCHCWGTGWALAPASGAWPSDTPAGHGGWMSAEAAPAALWPVAERPPRLHAAH
jgi:hypothetical protein